VRGKHISFTRGKRNSSPSTSLIKIEGCDSIQDADFYLGKRIAYVYRVRSPSASPWSFMFLADGVGATGNQGKQDPSYLGKGDEKSWKQWCCASKVQE
jgi:hypothetical protein